MVQMKQIGRKRFETIFTDYWLFVKLMKRKCDGKKKENKPHGLPQSKNESIHMNGMREKLFFMERHLNGNISPMK